jgi:hypothetical protein
MLTKAGLEFLLRITDYFGGHWEDPGWGQKASTQILLMTAVHELAEGIHQDAVRREVTSVLEKAIAETAQKVVKG